MGRWTREELEEAFENYQKVGLQAGTSGDWNPWADLFTEDCTYVEHQFGTFGGREAVRKWICGLMAQYPATEMKYYPIEWYVIDEERGWVICHVWNRLTDPGDGSLHQAGNISILKYAGHGKWKYQEDVYDRQNMMKMVEGWEQAKAKTA